jgi:hypothetical protein
VPYADQPLPRRGSFPTTSPLVSWAAHAAAWPALRRLAPALVAAVLAIAYLVVAPMSLDLAASEYRAQAVGRSGFSVWDLQWYGGHHMPGYSVTAPVLSLLLGPRLLGALSAVAATVLFERLAHSRYGDRAFAGALWFAAGSVTSLLSGRITFAAGLVPALGALCALDLAVRADDRRAGGLAGGSAVALAVLTGLTSPVAALFLAVAATAAGVTQRRPIALAVAACALGTVVLMAVAFPEGGVEPFGARSFELTVLFAVVALVAVPRTERTVRLGILLYVAGVVGSYVVPTPVGSNVVRLGALCTGPVLALTLVGHGRARLAVLLVLAWPLTTWQWSAATGDLRVVAGDPTVQSSYYTPLIEALDRQQRASPRDPLGGRLEIPFTRLHWESRWVAPRYALARGWERQVDIGTNPIFYRGPISASTYRGWLDRNAVRWVAVPASRLDLSAIREAQLIRRGLPYLRQVWANRDWRLFAVVSPTPLAQGPARITALSATSIDLDVARPGAVRLRVHWTPYWALTAGSGCVERAGDWTVVRVGRPGPVRLGIRFSLTRVAATTPRCRRQA